MAFNEIRNTKRQHIKTMENTYEFTQPDIKKGKGVGIMYNSKLEVTDLPTLEPPEATENINHSIQLTTKNSTIQIATIYCPRGKPNIYLFQEIIDRNPNTIIMGDMNVTHENINSQKPTSKGGREQSKASSSFQKTSSKFLTKTHLK